MPDFFISYTGVDQPWAEWIAVELEAVGYSTVLQAWDFTPGTDFVHEMHKAATSARRTVAVLSQDYFGSAFGETEWRAAFAKDPSGEQGLLVPVRVRECEPPGLLKTRVWLDLVGLREAEARQRLLTGVDRERPRPTLAGFPGEQTSPEEVGRSRAPFPGPRDDQPASVTNLPRANPGFVGRQAQLARIEEGLTRTGRVVISSTDRMAGIGKTQLALEYAHRHANEYEVVWQVASEQTDLIGGHLAQAAVRAGVVGPDVTTPAAMQAMHTALAQGRRWLLIFDNAEDSERLAEWLPPHGGHVIITSRSPGWHEEAVPVEVGLFARDESVDLLRRRIPALSGPDADRLADALGDLPLAVAQAASVVAQTGMPPLDFLDMLNEHATDVLDEGRPATYPRSLAASINLAMDRLERARPAAAQLLTLCATLAPEPIPVMLFTQALGSLPLPLGGTDRLGFFRVTKALADHGLAGISAEGLQVHRLVRAVVRSRAGDEAISDARAQVGGLLCAAAPDETDDPKSWPQWAALAPHLIAADPATSTDAALREAAARLVLNLLRRAEMHTALALVSELHQSWCSLLGPDHPHTLKAATEYAHARHELGERREAHEIVVDTLARYRATLGDDHPDTLRSAADLAVTVEALGDYAQARTLHEDTLTKRRRILGDDHPDTLDSAHSLSAALDALGDYAQARTLIEDTLTKRRRILGDDHPKTLDSAHNLAATLHALGDYAQARALDEDTLTKRRRILGDDHPKTLDSAYSFAATLHTLGDHTQARPLVEDTLTKRRRILGDNHPDTLDSAHSLAATLDALGDHTQARALDEDTLTKRRRILGDDHPKTLDSAHSLAATLDALGDHAQARALAEDTLTKRRRILGNDHPDTLSSARGLAIIYASMGRLLPARALIDDTLRRHSLALGPDHPRTKAILADQRTIAAMMPGAPPANRPNKRRPKKPKRPK